MVSDQNRAEGADYLRGFIRPEDVNIGLFDGYVYHGGEDNEMIYAGSVVVARDCPQAVREYGSAPFSFTGVPKIIGTHGVLLFQDCIDRAYLATIAVPEKYFGTGMAELLLKRLEGIALQREKQLISLVALKRNLRMHRFAIRHGYKVTRELSHLGRGDWVEMIKPLRATT